MIPARRRAAAVLLAVLGVVIAPMGVARAASVPDGTIGTVTVSGTTLEIPLSVTQDGEPVQVSGPTASVAINPVPGASLARTGEVQGGADASDTTVMLVLDTSASMKDDGRFTAEKSAARKFLHGLKPEVKVGLVTFGNPARLVVAPVADHAKVDAEIDGLHAEGDTALYEAVVKAAGSLPERGFSTMVMVTDGNNDLREGTDTPADVERSKTYQRRAKRLLDRNSHDGGIPFQGVIIGKPDQNDLEKIAPADSVQIVTDPTMVAKELQKLFQRGQAALDNAVRLRITNLPPEALRTSVNITVVGTTADGTRFTATSFQQLGTPGTPTPSATARGVPAASSSSGPPTIGTPVMVGALLAVFLAMTVLLTGATGALAGADRDAESLVTRALSYYNVRGSRPQKVAAQENEPTSLPGAVLRGAVRLVNRLARQRQLDGALDARLEAAGLPIRTAEWTLLHAGCGVGGALLLLIASRGMVFAALLGLVLGLALPWLFLAARRSRRETKFLAQLPDTLQLLAGSLAAGYSLPQAMDAVLRETKPPISVEFNRALIETRLGMPPEQALDGIADRTDSRDFSWIVMAIRIQREVGGNLAELLSTVADTLRERERLRRQVKALSAEGRLSGLILGALPLVFALFLILTKPEYIAPLFQTPLGLMLLATGTVLLAVGGFWMAKVVKVEV